MKKATTLADAKTRTAVPRLLTRERRVLHTAVGLRERPIREFDVPWAVPYPYLGFGG